MHLADTFIIVVSYGRVIDKLQGERKIMQEREKIKKLIEEHKALFEITNMDISESLRGQWLFSRYDSEHNYYDSLIRFDTAKELAEIILGELAIDILVTIDCEPEDKFGYHNFADDVQMKVNYKPHIERLIKYLEGL